MSTRSNLIIQDEYDRIQLYRHSDGYPDGGSGVLATIEAALEFAWQLPRFEASDFAAAIVRAWKEKGGGNIYIDGSPKAWEKVHSDTEWVYVVRQTKDGVVIDVYDWHENWLDKADTSKKDFQPKPVETIKIGEAKTKGLLWSKSHPE